ncbi:MAG: transcriptional repressor LexA [Thermoanaerobaculales bacterium]|jgi:repressor LexA|nr:transcriptional repressor LexA [Thermoanaerobaculales bacterium]
MTYLTERQRDVLRFIRARLDVAGVAPTLQEIADAFGFRSTASAQKHVAHLERKGFLERRKHQKRGLVLAGHGAASGAELPLFGVVAAGSPIESIPDEERVFVPSSFLRSGEHFVLRVRGDSMIDDGVHDGDLVVVQQAHAAKDGEMVVALVAGEVTLKRIYREGASRVRLQPANPALAPLLVPARELQVQGVVVGLLRRY